MSPAALNDDLFSLLVTEKSERSDTMDLGLYSKVALITGASRGVVGQAIATSLAAEGCHLVIVECSSWLSVISW